MLSGAEAHDTPLSLLYVRDRLPGLVTELESCVVVNVPVSTETLASLKIARGASYRPLIYSKPAFPPPVSGVS